MLGGVRSANNPEVICLLVQRISYWSGGSMSHNHTRNEMQTGWRPFRLNIAMLVIKNPDWEV